MKSTFFARVSLIIALAACGAAGWAQEPDGATPPPPPPPDGRFVLLHDHPMLEGLKPVTGAPFTAQATTEITQTLADGNQIDNKETATVARDSAGRTRRDGTISRIGLLAAEGIAPEIVRIVDPVAGASYVLDVNAKTAVQMGRHLRADVAMKDGGPPPFLSKFRDGDSSKSQRTTESLGNQVMAGVNAEGTRTTETIPAGAIGNQKPIVIVSERWYSPDLQETIYSKRTDPRFGTTIYQLANISRQEPDPSLFQVPADYTIKQGGTFRVRAK
jgi:hypothetical protein